MKKLQLKKIGKIASGSGAPKDNEFSDSGIPFIRVSNLDEIIISNNELQLPKISVELAKKKRIKLTKKNSVIFAKSGMSCMKDRVYKLKNDAYIVNHLASVFCNDEIISADYLKYYLEWYSPSKLVIDESYPSIRLSDIGNLEIPLPPLQTQRKIVEVLDKAQAIIDARKEQITLLDEYIQSIFYDMFGDPVTNPKGWEVKKISEVIKIDTKMVRDFKQYADYPHIGINNIEKNTGKLINFHTVQEDKVVSGKYLFSPKHIIYSKIRPNLNKVALPNFHGLCSADSYPLLVNEEKADKIYIALILRSDYFLNEILKHSSRTNIPKVNKSQLLSFKCILPPIHFQNQFANIVQKIEAQKQLMEKSLVEMENNFNSLMQRAFKGELFS